MHISRNLLIATLALGVVAIESASTPASAATETTTMSIGLTIVAPSDPSAARIKAPGAQRNSIDKATIAALRAVNDHAVKPELTTHRIADARSNSVVVTLSY